ncbi:MAG: glutaredoxin family protein [Betaproteobacteria bacterium]|nr:MAG: glutaredoxin family protein [Betaproteobacteria bacterium]
MRLTLYGRGYCHLCEDMLAALEPIGARLGFEVDVVDVDRDPALEARYGERVPVLAHGDIDICHYHLDCARLTAYLAAFR